MTTSAVAIGLTGLSVAAMFGAGEVFDAWRYRDHPNTDPIAELRDWAFVAGLWAIVTAVAWVMA